MKLLNLGCGNRYHENWTNVDFIKTGDSVIACDLLKEIPFTDSAFDVVYHSHLLEHFSKQDAERFMLECYRVLKNNGIMRIAVPDLEMIAKEYLINLERAVNGEYNANNDYEWIMLELFDQTTRNYSGGEMAKYIQRINIPNQDYVFKRFGHEARLIHQNYIDSISSGDKKQKETKRGIGKSVIRKMYRLIFPTKIESPESKIGHFRLSGEVHQWMYDRHSLSKLLHDCKFKNIRIVSAFESEIEDWEKYQLDSIDGVVRKPDSLFLEANK